jgi:hypothetical protein
LLSQAAAQALEALSARLPVDLLKEVTEALLAALKDGYPLLSQAAAQALEALSARLLMERVKEVTEALLAALKDEYAWKVRQGNVLGLNALSARLPEERVKEVTEALLAALKDNDEDVRQAVANVLEVLSARLPVEDLQFLINLLLNALNNPDFDQSTDGLVKTLVYLLGTEYLNKVVGSRIRSYLASVYVIPTVTSKDRGLDNTKLIRQDILTLPDGNCAMNAVALGICELALNNKEQLVNSQTKTLFDILNPLLLHKTGSTLSAWLEKETDNDKRQSILAPILRELAVKYIESHVAYYKDSYEAGLLAAFEQYKLNQVDDTFCVHSHVRKKFAELSTLANVPDQSLEIGESKEGQETKELLDWWNNGVGNNPSGFQEYLNHLKLPARGASDRERWGSEVEIGALAVLLEITIKNVKPGIEAEQEQLLGIGYGYVLGLSKPEIDHLVNLGVGSRFQGNFRIEIAEKQELIQKLQLETLTAAEKVYLDKDGRETILAFMGNVRNCPVPERAGMQELCDKLKRLGLFVQNKNQPLRFVNEAVLNARLTPIPAALQKKVLAAHLQPLCFAIEHVGAHWSYRKEVKNTVNNTLQKNREEEINNSRLTTAFDKKRGGEKERDESRDVKKAKDRKDCKESEISVLEVNDKRIASDAAVADNRSASLAMHYSYSSASSTSSSSSSYPNSSNLGNSVKK